jgi:hypothetical protein
MKWKRHMIKKQAVDKRISTADITWIHRSRFVVGTVGLYLICQKQQKGQSKHRFGQTEGDWPCLWKRKTFSGRQPLTYYILNKISFVLPSLNILWFACFVNWRQLRFINASINRISILQPLIIKTAICFCDWH